MNDIKEIPDSNKVYDLSKYFVREDEIISDVMDSDDKRTELNTNQERLVFCDKSCLLDYLNNEVFKK